jgi:hypothetical protein
MNKERLEWVLSGLRQYALTEAEDTFLTTAAGDFEKNQVLTKRQEDRIETLYKDKSARIPERKTDPSYVRKKANPKKKVMSRRTEEESAA